jgi:general stress protein 26
MPMQFDNPANVEAHRRGTAAEIAADFPEGLDYLITGVGTGGHITACAEVLRARWPGLRVFAVEPTLSPVLSGGSPGPHSIQGIGAGFVPGVLRTDLLDGVITVETKAKSQKVKNLRRDPRVTFLVEAGEAYEELRGVELVGRAQIIEDAERIWEFGVSIWERYYRAYDESQRQAVQAMVHNRVVVRLDVQRVVSWDHRKLAGL